MKYWKKQHSVLEAQTKNLLPVNPPSALSRGSSTWYGEGASTMAPDCVPAAELPLPANTASPGLAAPLPPLPPLLPLLNMSKEPGPARALALGVPGFKTSSLALLLLKLPPAASDR